MVEAMLTFEVHDDGQLDVFMNREGIRHLDHVLRELERSEDHTHLMTKEWGGVGLSSEQQTLDGTLLNKVTFRFVP